jgi:hypothetical protein
MEKFCRLPSPTSKMASANHTGRYNSTGTEAQAATWRQQEFNTLGPTVLVVALGLLLLLNMKAEAGGTGGGARVRLDRII